MKNKKTGWETRGPLFSVVKIRVPGGPRVDIPYLAGTAPPKIPDPVPLHEDGCIDLGAIAKFNNGATCECSKVLEEYIVTVNMDCLDRIGGLIGLLGALKRKLEKGWPVFPGSNIGDRASGLDCQLASLSTLRDMRGLFAVDVSVLKSANDAT